MTIHAPFDLTQTTTGYALKLLPLDACPDRESFITYKASESQECKGIAMVLNIEGSETLKFIIDNRDSITH